MDCGRAIWITKANLILLLYFILRPTASTHDVTLTELYVLVPVVSWFCNKSMSWASMSSPLFCE